MTDSRGRSGKRPKNTGNYTFILGWSNRIFPILQELAVASSNVRKPRVVILSNQSTELMESEIQSRLGKLGKLKVITRTGEPTNSADLKNTDISRAKSIIVLASDAELAPIVAAIQSADENGNTKIVAEIENASTGEDLRRSTDGQVITVRSQEIIARVTAQASRSAGLATVVLDLLDFDGDEIYFADVPALFGKTYADSILAFNTASVIGLLRVDGKVLLNPTQDTVIAAGTKIIAIAEDDDKIIYTGVREDIAKTPVTQFPKRKQSVCQLLIIGWSPMGRAVLTELAQFLPKGSSVHIVAQEKYVASSDLVDLTFGDLAVKYETVTDDLAQLNKLTKDNQYSEIIVLGYRHGISESEADKLTVATISQVNNLLQGLELQGSSTRLVAEILDSSQVAVPGNHRTGELVVSDSLAAFLMAQISENPSLAPVFEDLFDAQGATLNIRDITGYAPIGKSVSFAELVATARNHGESAIGYRLASGTGAEGSTGVVLNPSKTSEFIPVEGDSLVVIGNL